MRRQCALTLFELLIVVCVILVCVGTFAIYADKVLRAARETALRNELIALRMSLEHYRIIRGRYPAQLNELTNPLTKDEFNSKIDQSSFIKSLRLDKKGFAIDPFMNRYSYNKEEGLVNSQTRGCERW